MSSIDSSSTVAALRNREQWEVDYDLEQNLDTDFAQRIENMSSLASNQLLAILSDPEKNLDHHAASELLRRRKSKPR